MPALRQQERKATFVRFSANLKPETKAILEDYAYKKRMSLALALDTIIKDAAKEIMADRPAS